MAFMTWDNSLDTGISAIDAQHKQIVTFINDLHEAASKDDKKMVEDVLEGLVNYTVSHFAFEEDLCEQNNYPNLEAHKKEHQEFITRIGKYQTRHKQGANIARALSVELQLWLSKHIKEADGDYVSSIDIKTQSPGALSSMLKKYF